MIETQRRAYLEAMGIEVWYSKTPQILSRGLFIGPGQGSTLLICGEAVEAAGRMAADIARATAADPVWGWPDPDGGGAELPDAVSQQLFTRVIIFGRDLAAQLLRGAVPETLGCARIIVSDTLSELASSGAGKRAFWSEYTGVFGN